MTTRRPKVLYIQPVHDCGMAYLRDRYDVVVAPDVTAFTSLLPDADAVVTRLTRIDRAVLDLAPHLKVIGRHGIGVDNIDVELAAARGVKVITTADANSTSVAEHTLLAIGSLYKQIPWFDRQTRAGNWQSRDRSRARELAGKTLGIVGMGNIGRTLARMACLGMGMHVRFHDPYASPTVLAEARAAGYEHDHDLDDLLRRVDVVSVHTPLTDETAGLIDARRLRLMHGGAFVVNFARGGIVDEHDLAQALRDGTIAGAAVDVYAIEPLTTGHPFLGLDNIVLSPHCSFLTEESLERMSMTLAHGIDAILGASATARPTLVGRS